MLLLTFASVYNAGVIYTWFTQVVPYWLTNRVIHRVIASVTESPSPHTPGSNQNTSQHKQNNYYDSLKALASHKTLAEHFLKPVETRCCRTPMIRMGSSPGI
jgi:hypothetical protein